MAKKVTTISIDENILRQAKKEIPNMSIFVEDCFKAYLGYDNTVVKSIDEHMQTIQKSLLDIHILTAKGDEINITETYNLKEQNRAWNLIFGKFRKNENITIDEFENASKILNIPIRDLKELLENIEFNVSSNDLIRCNDWEFAKKQL